MHSIAEKEVALPHVLYATHILLDGNDHDVQEWPSTLGGSGWLLPITNELIPASRSALCMMMLCSCIFMLFVFLQVLCGQNTPELKDFH